MGKVLGGSVTLVDDKTPSLSLVGAVETFSGLLSSEIVEVERMKGPDMQLGKHLYNMFTVTFSDLDHAFPSDARPPYMDAGDFSGVLGSNLELPCTPPRGKPAPVVRWKKDGSPLDLGRKEKEPLLAMQNAAKKFIP